MQKTLFAIVSYNSNPDMINEIKNRILQSFNSEIRSLLAARIKEVLPAIQRRQQEDLDRLIEIIINGGID